MPAYLKHLKIVLKGLKYQTLDNLIGREIIISSVESVENDILSTLAEDIPAESSFIVSKDPLFKDAVEKIMAKYGFIDAKFSISNRYLKNLPRINRKVLEELYFVNEREDNENFKEEDALFAFQELAKDIEENKAYLKLFIEMKNRREYSLNVIKNIKSSRKKGIKPKYELPKDFFPQIFVITDACLTNSGFVWINKHFYL